MSDRHNRQGLNNHLQKLYRHSKALTWEVNQLENQWEAVAFIYKVEYGRAQAATIADAKELAAKRALDKHESEGL